MASSQRGCEGNDSGVHIIEVILITNTNILSAIMNITASACFILNSCV